MNDPELVEKGLEEWKFARMEVFHSSILPPAWVPPFHPMIGNPYV
jgi:hypothetical protein